MRLDTNSFNPPHHDPMTCEACRAEDEWNRGKFMESFFKGLREAKGASKPADHWQGKFMGYPVAIDAPPMIRKLFVEALTLGREVQKARS
jgi:hypothetical protein